ncbi:MAG TPA: peptide chain release factor N(5)-glutamine methyltransferase [Nakamurella sp.]
MSRQSLRSAILAATATLDEAGVPSPGVDAEELAAHLLGVSRTRLGMTPLVESSWLEGYRSLVARRAERVPLQHIVGSVQFGRAHLVVGPGVFVPRPETESLVVWALDVIAGVTAPLVVDLCAGSGAIALAISAARPDARVIAVERSPSALAFARRNIVQHIDSGGTRVELRGGDVTDQRLLADLDGTADLVLANPPYVPDGTPVEPEVANFDPPEAVFGGPDGLTVIKPLISVAAGLLKVGGALAIEHDDTQGETVPDLLRARRVLTDVVDHQDLAGRPRFVTATRVRMVAADIEPPAAAAPPDGTRRKGLSRRGKLRS